MDLPRKQPPAAEELCAHAALSIFADVADIPIAKEFVPGFKNRKIARAVLQPHMGVVLNTPSKLPLHPNVVLKSHHDWWVYVSFNPISAFQVIGL